MAAISHVFTIRRAAQILGRDEDLLWELSDQLEPEDGKLWVCDIDGAETPRLHPRWHRGSSRNYQGSDRSRRLISRRVYRGAQRMLTFDRIINRINRTAEAYGQYTILICDEGQEVQFTRRLRKMRVHNPIPSDRGVWEDTGAVTKNIPVSRILEDPFFKDSSTSYFVQLVDFCAYALLRMEKPIPSR